jgi:hypothetical protein
LLASTVVLASCGQLFGIQERDYTPVPDSGAVLDARSEDAGVLTDVAEAATSDVAEAATDVAEASTNDVVEAGCTPCVIASSTIDNCCVQ